MEKIQKDLVFKAMLNAYEKSFFKELVKLEDCKFVKDYDNERK